MEKKEKETKELKLNVKDIALIFYNDLRNKYNMEVLDKAFGKIVDEVKKILTEINYEEFSANVFQKSYFQFLENFNLSLDLKDMLWISTLSILLIFVAHLDYISILRQIPGEYGQIVNYYLVNIIENFDDTIGNIIANPNIPINVLIQFFNTDLKEIFDLDTSISNNPGITLDDIEKHTEIVWDYSYLSNNKNINWKFVLNTMNTSYYRHLPEEKKWNFTRLSSNPIITFDIVKKYKYNWNYNSLSGNPNITTSIVQNNPQIKWDYRQIASFNTSIKLKELLTLRDVNKIKISDNEIKEQYISNKNLTINDLLKFWQDELENDLYEMTINPGISITNIIDNPQLSWEIDSIIENPNMTFNTIIENKHIFEIDIHNINDILKNEYGYNTKHRNDVKFPKLWLMVYYLSEVIGVDEQKEIKEIYTRAEKIYNEINKIIENILLTNTIPKEINDFIDNNDITKGIIKYVLKEDFKEFMLSNDFFDKIHKAYKKLGGIQIIGHSEPLDKKQCGEETENEFFTQEEFKNVEVKDLISFEIENKIYCLNRQSLIDFWNMEPDEFDKSQAYKWGDCDLYDDEPDIDTCKRFYKIPISFTALISERDKNKIQNRPRINYWKLIYDKTVSIGRGSGYEGEYGVPDEKIYMVIPVEKYSKE